MELRTDRYKLKEIFPDKARKYAQKLKKKADTFEFIRKGIPINPKDIDIKEGERAAIRLVTTPHLDRDGEILIPSGAILDDFRESPSVLYAHDYKGLPIGHDQWIKPVKEGILAKTLYAKHQFAEDVYQCVKHKDLNSNSVGFIPVEAVPPEEKKRFKECQDILEKEYGIDKKESGKAKSIYATWIMLEHSDVPVASNAQSLNLAVSKGELVIISDRLKKDLEIEVVKDKEIEIFVDRELGIPIASIAKDKEIEVIKESDAKKEKELKEEKTDEATEEKVETTENYHRIPVSTGHSGHRIRTITISASQGIKALYCGECKKVITYLFDVKKWSMEEAKKWVADHKEFNDIVIKEPEYKERWNKSLSKLFDIESAETPAPLRFSYDLYEKFLECKVKEIFLNSYSIPSPLLGTYLAGFKEILKDFKLKDTRSFLWDGSEHPPISEIIKLNSEKSDDFLIDGMCFYDADNEPLIVKYEVNWTGIDVSIITSNKNKEWNKELLDKVHDWVHENNYLKGEKFSLSGEFLDEPGDNWDNLILDAKYKDSIVKSANFLEKKGKDLTGRGLLFIGPPGTGKTKTGRVLMNELDATFIWVSSRDFRHIGPLKALSLGFSLARDLAPSILFLEDIDTWLRGEMEFVTDLVKTEMDGIKQNKGLITIMTSNYPEKLPDALLDRPGRFHHIINFELPKEQERGDMLIMWAGEIELKLLDDLVEKTKGFSGAHLKELVEFAKMIAEEDETEIGEALLKSLDKLIEQRELIEEIRDNKTDTKAIWGKMKWVDGDIEVKSDREIEVEAIKEHDDKVKEYQKECEHEWAIDKNRKGDPSKPTAFCLKCGEEQFGEQELIAEAVDYTSLEFAIKGLTDEVAELKEGRVLSTKNRIVLKDFIDTSKKAIEMAEKLYTATEPPSREEERTVEVEREKRFVIEKDGDKVNLEENMIKVVEKIMSDDNLKKLVTKSIDEAVDIKFKKKMGKVE